MPYISAVLRRGQEKKEKEVRVFYIAYVIRLAHESSDCDENRPATKMTMSRSDVSKSYRARERQVPLRSHGTKLSPVDHLPGLGRPIEEGPGISFPVT